MRARLHALGVVGALAFSSACSSAVPARPEPAGQPSSAIVFENLLLAAIEVDGVSSQVAVDTGSPIVNLSPASFPGAAIPDGNGTVATLTIGARILADQAVVGAALVTNPDPKVALGGVLGCTVLCGYATSLNYRDAELTLGKAPAPADLQADVAIPFQLEGGGLGQLDGVSGTINFPASRIAVTAIIEGVSHPMVLDTGATDVFVRQAIFTQITSDGRTTLPLEATSVDGMSMGKVTRLKSVVVGGAEVLGPPASEDADIDTLLDGVAQEVGHPVDGLLGGTYLHDFYVTVDYPARTLHLARYENLDFLADEYERVGVEVNPPDASGALVIQVTAGTDAAMKGVEKGDLIVAVDGQKLASLGQTAAMQLLSGQVGATKNVQFGAARSAALADKTVAILVDELLPLP